MHFADILNSQLMYKVQLLMIKGALTLILSFPKAWFLVQIPCSIYVASSIALFRSLSFGLWHRKVIASSASKTVSVAAEQRAFLVFPARNSILDLFVGRFVDASSSSRELKKTTTATATATAKSRNKSFNEQNNISHVRYNSNSWYISLPSSAKQERENDQVLRCLENVNLDG